MPHPLKGRPLTAEKLDRARAALAEIVRCEDVPGRSIQDLERAQRTIEFLYRQVPRSPRR